MATTPVSLNSVQSDYQSYYAARNSDLKQLGQALQSGDLSAAQQDFQAIQDLGQSGPFGGDAFKMSGREKAFDAIGQALQSGDLQDAQAAYGHLMNSFHRGHDPVHGSPITPLEPSKGQPVAGTGSTAGPQSSGLSVSA
jgi:hypothetical protein